MSQKGLLLIKIIKKFGTVLINGVVSQMLKYIALIITN